MKPKILYHGSWNKEIEEFEPRIAQQDPEPRVYASHDVLTALLFMPKYNGYMSVGDFGTETERRHYIIFTESKEKVLNQDGGGAVYSLPSETFEKNPLVNGGEWEWYSTVPVKPVDKQVFNSWIHEFKKRGISIFFFEEPKFHEFEKLEPIAKAKFLQTIKSEI